MQARPNLNIQLTDLIGDGNRTLDGAVPLNVAKIHLPPCLSHDRENVRSPCAKLCSRPPANPAIEHLPARPRSGGTDDIQKQDSCQNTIRNLHRARSSYEFFHLCQHAFRFDHVYFMGRTGELHELGPGMWDAKSRAASTLTAGSSVRFITRVGTRIAIRIGRMSISAFIRF